MKLFVKKNTWARPPITTGWGNGYVVIPESHPLYGVDYMSIHELMPELSIHGGLTFSRPTSSLKSWGIPKDYKGWVVGFDTAHCWDTLNTCPKSFVLNETLKLKEQLESYIINH